MDAAKVSREKMAEIMDVSPSTISRWCNDEDAPPPRRPYLHQWAMVTGVDPTWLETGAGSPNGGGGADPIDRARALAQLAASKRPKGGPEATRWYPTPALVAA